ncbi:MAG: hypothetical protein K1X28_01145 [Parachlamydiales bacterium]|nr:hypothetical protein [Parachlamydiales bacterium]
MTIHEQQSDFAFSFGRPSHRTRPEQLVGLGIYLMVSFGFLLISGLNTLFLSVPYALFLSLGMWALWRRYSLRVLKLELSVFLAQFLFQLGWRLDIALLVLVSLLLLNTTTLLAALLFWKKERAAGVLYTFPLLWVFYLACLNMITSIKGT